MQPFSLYLVLEFSAAPLFSLIFTVNSLYQVTVVQLSLLQLVLLPLYSLAIRRGEGEPSVAPGGWAGLGHRPEFLESRAAVPVRARGGLSPGSSCCIIRSSPGGRGGLS